MKLMDERLKLPDFIVKSTLGVALSTLLILTPFTINNFMQGRYLLGFFTSCILILCCMNAWFGFQQKYHAGLNSFAIAPILSLAIVIAVYELGVAGSYWVSLGVISFYFILPERRAWIANVVFVGVVFPIAWKILEPELAVRFFAVTLGVSFFALISIHEIYKQHYKLRELAITDNLTGLYNRSQLQHSLEQAIHQSGRTKTAMTLIMLDLDYFKVINDELGHDVGDVALKSLGAFLKKRFRASDMVFRIGGEEFLVLLHNSDHASSMEIAEELRRKIEGLPLTLERIITASLGVSSFEPGMDWKEWMKECDENMYRAKFRGRNQVVG